MIKIAILPFWLWLTSIIPCQNCVQKEAPLRFSQSSNHNQKAIITLMKLFSQYPRVYVFILPYFTWTFHVSHLWGNQVPSRWGSSSKKLLPPFQNSKSWRWSNVFTSWSFQFCNLNNSIFPRKDIDCKCQGPVTYLLWIRQDRSLIYFSSCLSICNLLLNYVDILSSMVSKIYL